MRAIIGVILIWLASLASILVPDDNARQAIWPSVLTYLEESSACDNGSHSFHTVTLQAATDLEHGMECYVCGQCDEAFLSQIPKLPHIHKYEETITKAPNCTENGIRERSCYCGDSFIEPITKTGHTMSEWQTVQWATCKQEGRMDRSCHCGYKEAKSTPVIEHTFTDWHVAREATCTKDGTLARQCNICGVYEYQSIPVTPHSFAITSSVPATPDQEGRKVYTCSCGASYEEKTPKVANRWKWEIEQTHKKEIKNAYEYYASETLIVIISKMEWGHSKEVFVSHVFIKSPSQLKADMANGGWNNGIGVELPTSAARRNNAVLLTNGGNFSLNNPTPDFPYGMTGGWSSTPRIMHGKNINGVDVVKKNGTICFFKDGDFRVVPNGTTAAELLAQGTMYTIQFGPTLVENYQAIASEWSNYGQSYCPRTVWGIKRPLEYYVMVSSGAYYSNGLSYDECASLFVKLGCRTAINFDGGGSSSLIFKGKMLNVPGSTSGPEERRVTDFVFFTD